MYNLHFCEQKHFVLSFIIGHGHLSTNNLLLVAVGSDNLLIEVCGSEVYQYYCNPMTAAGDRRLRPTQWTVLLQYYNSLHRPAQSPHPPLSEYWGIQPHGRFCPRHL